MVVNRSAPPADDRPTLVCEDLDVAIEWLRDALGFYERSRWVDGDGIHQMVMVQVADVDAHR